MSLGAENTYANYILGGSPLGESVMEKDLGVLVDHRLTINIQCQATAKKASKIFSCIKKCIHSRDKTVILPLYETLDWPLLEYVVVF